MYRIGLFSKIGKTTIKTLRYYDEVGLLKPQYIDEENGYRYYTTDQLFDLHKIVALRQIGFSVNEVLTILSGRDVEEILDTRKAELESKSIELNDKLSRINYFIKEKKEGFSMNYQVVIKELPKVTVFSKRMIVKNYSDYFTVIPKLGQQVSKANPELKCRVPEYCFIIYHDGEYKESNIDVEYCEAVEKMGKETQGITFKEIEGTKAATVMHKGSYANLSKAYAYLFKWVEDNGYQVKDCVRESYIDGIWNKESEEEWLTEIQIPIK